MAYYLASVEDQLRRDWTKRFRPDLWTVDFPRPMMAAITTPDPETLRLDLDFLTRSDLAGLIWSSEDKWSHPLLAYETMRDYRHVVLSFDWVSGPGVMALDALNGPVLTIEGRDEQGQAKSWYVRLWNYASGTPTSARVELNFNLLRAGFGEAGEAVFAGDIERMFISLVPADFDGSADALVTPVATQVELRNLRTAGHRSMMRIGDAFLPEHQLSMCSGYDDSYNQAPERLVAQWQALGFRKLVTHYVGMSHFPALQHVGGGRFEVAGGVCGSARTWHRQLLRAISGAGMEAVLSLSFELFDSYAPPAWAQRDADGNRALTGWAPPSTLLSPCNAAAIGWLGGVASEFSAMAATEADRVNFQIGEPWWWVGPSGWPHFYDDATVHSWTVEKGAAPPVMQDVLAARTGPEQQWLDWLGAKLAAACAAVRAAARLAAAGKSFRSHLLFYAPQVLIADAPDLQRANMPVGWAYPEWDVLQLEDYDFVTEGNHWGQERGRRAVTDALGYPLESQHYFSGFVALPERAGVDWPRIAVAAGEAQLRGVPAVFVWAWPQIARDGFTWTGDEDGETDMEGFHDVRFPLAVGFEAVGGPEFSTQVAELVSGHEQRNLLWAEGRLRYDAGLGVRSEADLARVIGFFRARRGQAFAFRFRDPMDWNSGDLERGVTAADQFLGVADGQTTRFQLVKRYGSAGMEEVRRITRPDPATVQVAVDGVVQSEGWNLQDGGIVQFDIPPAPGAEIRAGYAFDVPVRFAVDRLEVSVSGVRSGDIPSIPLLEVRE